MGAGPGAEPLVRGRLCVVCPVALHVSVLPALLRRRKDDITMTSSTYEKLRGSGETGEEALGGSTYRPTMKETRATHEILLSFIQQLIGDQVRAPSTRSCMRGPPLHVFPSCSRGTSFAQLQTRSWGL